MRYQRISADCHIDLPWMPPDLFTANASAVLKERMPFVKDGPDGPFWTARNGTQLRPLGRRRPGRVQVRGRQAPPRGRHGRDRSLR